MADFEFDFGVNSSDTGSNASIAFTDEGVNFTLSTTGNAPGTILNHFPNFAFDGELSVSGYNAGVPIVLDVTGGDTNTVSGFFQGNGLQLELGGAIVGGWNAVFVNAGADATPNPNLTVAITGPGQIIDLGTATTEVYSEIQFVPTTSGGFLSIDSLNATLLCFLEGMRIATPEGEKRVEELRAGDTVSTADGGTTTVQWLGQQPVDIATANPARVNPVRIRAGALADGVPARDLLVSPDHAIGIDGYLVNASALVNGTTVTREARMPGSTFTYYHVETGTHELLLAEGCAAESYVDFVGREGFVNGAERADAPAIPEMAVPRISAARHLPPQLRERIAAQATGTGESRAA